MSPLKKYEILLLGWYGYKAIGDDVIGQAISNLFQQEAAKRGISVGISSLKNNSLPARLYRSHFKKYDLIVIGGGSILGNDSMHLYPTIFGIEKLHTDKIMKNSSTPLVIFGGGFRKELEGLSSVHADRMRRLFERASLKGVRGPLTRELLIKSDVIDDIQIIGDPALSFKPTPIATPFDGDLNIGMNIRSMGIWEKQYISNSDISKIFAQIADFFIDYGANIHFFSFTENMHDSDTKGAQTVIRNMRNKRNYSIIPFKNDVDFTCSLLGKFDYLVSQRLHACILSWLQSVPNIGFDYQFLKTMDFMSSIGMKDYCVRTDQFTLDNYVDKYEQMMKSRNDIIVNSQQRMNTFKSVQQEFVNHSLDLMRGGE